MTGLIEKLEGAEAGSRELDSLVECAAGLAVALDGHGRAKAGDGTRYRVPAYSTSLDAALALAERVLPGWDWHVTTITTSIGGVKKVSALVAPFTLTEGEEITSWSDASTPALALCIAILRARQSNGDPS